MVNQNIKLATVSIGALTVGFAAGVFVAHKSAVKKYKAMAEAEIQSVKKTYSLLKGEDEFADPATAVADFRKRSGYLERLDELQYLSAVEEEHGAEGLERYSRGEHPTISPVPADGWGMVGTGPRKLEEVLHPGSVGVDAQRRDGDSNSSDDRDVSGEDPPRGTQRGEAFTAPPVPKLPRPEPVDTSKPYLISQQEFFQDDEDYDHLTITWYSRNQMLLDERDDVISNMEATVGLDNMKMFGQPDADDPNVLHIRNENTKVKFEVLLSTEDYFETVLGVITDERS